MLFYALFRPFGFVHIYIYIYIYIYGRETRPARAICIYFVRQFVLVFHGRVKGVVCMWVVERSACWSRLC